MDVYKFKKEPIFSYKRNFEKYIKGGKENPMLMLGTMKNIGRPTRTPHVNAVMFFECGYRVVGEILNEHWQYWNGCTYEDIDYKNWLETHTDEPTAHPLQLFYQVFNYLCENYPKVFYYGEISRSGKGMHYVFYWDWIDKYLKDNKIDRSNLTENDIQQIRIEHSEEYFHICKRTGEAMIKKAFDDLKYGDIIRFKRDKRGGHVWDDCSTSVMQLMHQTYKCGTFNFQHTGEIEKYKDLNILPWDKDEKQKREQAYKEKCEKNMQAFKDYDIDIVYTDVKETFYIDHYNRWHLYDSLRTLYGEGDEFDKQWERCAGLMQEQNGHTEKYYIDLPEKSDWSKKYEETEDHYVDVELLKRFGINVLFLAKHTEEYTKTVTDMFSLL